MWQSDFSHDLQFPRYFSHGTFPTVLFPRDFSHGTFQARRKKKISGRARKCKGCHFYQTRKNIRGDPQVKINIFGISGGRRALRALRQLRAWDFSHGTFPTIIFHGHFPRFYFLRTFPTILSKIITKSWEMSFENGIVGKVPWEKYRGNYKSWEKSDCQKFGQSFCKITNPFSLEQNLLFYI